MTDKEPGRPSGPRRRKRWSIRDSTLASWRGYWEPEDLDKNSKNLQEVVNGALKDLGLGNRLQEEEIVGAWNEVAGDFIAQHARPVAVKHRVLWIQVLQPAIHYSLEREKGELLRRFQERFGEKQIRDIRFRIG